MRRKVTARDWRFPRRMTRKQWSVLPYAERHADVGRRSAICSAIGATAPRRAAAGRGAASLRIPATDRKQAMTPAEWAAADAVCRPLRALLSLGSLKGSEGLWLF